MIALRRLVAHPIPRAASGPPPPSPPTIAKAAIAPPVTPREPAGQGWLIAGLEAPADLGVGAGVRLQATEERRLPTAKDVGANGQAPPIRQRVHELGPDRV